MSFEDSDEEGHAAGGSEKVIHKNHKFTTLHMVAFIITCVAGREYSNWQPALSQGFGLFMIAELILAFAFINSYFCLAEIWSAIPFSGGGYGLARAVIGFYPGFLVGIADALVYITHSAVGALFLGDKICEVDNLNRHMTLIFVFIAYFCAVLLAIQPSTVVLRRSFVFLAVLSLLILFVYVFGSFGWSDFARNASLHRVAAPNDPKNWFDGGMKSFMTHFPYASQPYAGVKSFTLMCAMTVAPKVTLPKAVAIGVSLIFVINMFVVFVNAAQPGGILATAALPLPMSVGFEYMFKINKDYAYHLVAFLSFPAFFGKVYAYMIPCGTLLQSLGRTNLLPSFLGLNHTKDATRGTIVSASLGFCMCLLIHFVPSIDLYNICLIATVFSNVTSSYCYIKLKYQCPTLERGFVNPLGSVGAAVSALLFMVMFVSAGFFGETYDPLIGITVIFVILTVYYYGFAVKTQTLCKEEDKVFLLLHVKNFNKNKKKHNRFKGNRAQIPHYKSHHDSSVHGESTVRGTGNVSSASASVSYSSSSEISTSGLWGQVRRYNMFGNNVVSPSSTNASSLKSMTFRFLATSTVVPASTTASAVEAAVVEEKKVKGVEFREAEML